jgi:hypothetical protein
MSSLEEIGARCGNVLEELADSADSPLGVNFDEKFRPEDQLIRFRLWEADLGIDHVGGYRILEEKLRMNLEVRAMVEQLLTCVYENAEICRCSQCCFSSTFGHH